jgi:hypothetical protein
VTDRSERLAERSEQAADIALGSAAVAQKAAKKVVDALPRPDVRDDPNFARLAGQEQTWLAKLSPRRNFWPAVAAVDARIADLDRRQGELHDRLADLRRRRAEAGSDYASRLAAWMAGDQEGQKPLPEAATLDEAISEAAAEHAAIDRLREDVLADKIALVERRRRSLVRDAERAVGQAKRRYLAAVDAVEAAREELVDLNQTRIWAAVYPSDTLQTYPPDHVMVAGR